MTPVSAELKKIQVALVARHLEGYQFEYALEAELQAGIAQALEDLAPGRYVREHVLPGAAGRIDFYFPNSKIGIEAKAHRTGGSLAEIIRQVARYAECPEIEGLVVISGDPRVRAEIPPAFFTVPIICITARSALA